MRLAALCLSIFVFAVSTPTLAAEKELTVAAAISLRQVMPELTKAFRDKDGGGEILVHYGASGDLRRQVEAGAPVDVVVFASGGPIDELIKGGHAEASTRRVVATNVLVLIGPKGAKPLTFATIESMAAGEMLAIGDPGAVPAGDYARKYLQALGKWDALDGRIVLGGDVGAVLNYARRGEVAAAVVYRTEIRGVDDVVVLDEARGELVPPIEVVSAVTKDSSARGRALAEFLASDKAREILRGFGFGIPAEAGEAKK